MSDKQISPHDQAILTANRVAALRACAHDLRVMVETRGVDAVMEALDEATYRKLEAWFDLNVDYAAQG